MSFINNFLLYTYSPPVSLCLCLGIVLLVGIFAYIAKTVTPGGFAAALLVGTLVLWCTGIEGFLVLLFFLVSSAALGRGKKKETEAMIEKNGARDASQVLANGFAAAVFALAYYATGKALMLCVFLSCIAEANADTWAGEIGRKSKTQPVSLRTGLPVPPGLSGGVTLLGFAGGMLGAAVIPVLFLILSPGRNVGFGKTVMISSLTGFIGCVADSWLGSTFQALYSDGKGNLTEKKDGNILVRGMERLDNDTVNFISNLTSAAFCAGLGLLTRI